MVEDRRAILRADIVALTIERRRVVEREEHLQNIVEGDLRRVECDLNNFGMAGVAVADLAVGRVTNRAARVARHDILDTLQIVEDRLEAPEAATTQRGNLVALRIGILIL